MTMIQTKKIEEMREEELLLELLKPLAQIQQNKEELDHVQVQLAELKALMLDMARKKTNN